MVYPDRPDYRIVIVGGVLVAAAVIIGQLVDDDSVVLLGIEIQHSWLDDPPES